MFKFPLVSKININRARTEFLSHGTVPAGRVPEHIFRSWQRSQGCGVDMERENSNIAAIARKELVGLTEKNRTLLVSSYSVMENLYEQIHDSSSMVLLADATGVVLHSLGDSNFVSRARKVALQPGGIWSEQVRGTNAIGTALVEQRPIVVHSSEHYVQAHDFLTCSASPIFDPYGKLLGALDVSSDCRAYQQHTMALVRISVQQIENQMFANGFESDICIQFHNRPEFIGTMYEAIAVFSRDGQLLAANRSALLHLNLDRYQAQTATFRQLFDIPFDALLLQADNTPQPVIRLPIAEGLNVYARVRMSPGYKQRFLRQEKPETATRPRLADASETRLQSLNALEYGDTRMRTAIDKAQRVLGHDIPVLIEGESGTGKELFARAMHQSNSRRSGPFVALNCAAIPEGLIESELFGYQEGAFTGAKRKGNIGKIRQANGGTLFLDEIGDMPLALQARLLRVLQERSITPLGDGTAHPVDIAVICATNRKLRDEIAANRFREDLYYRLNGLVIILPPLREREDLLQLSRSILADIAGPLRSVRLCEDVLNIFSAHPWPGNLRQMHNVLRTALALLGSDEEITLGHLSDDFLEQAKEAVPVPARQQAQPCRTIGSASPPESLDSLEAQAIQQAMAGCQGNISAAARQLGISRNTLYRKMRLFSA
ncbi:sigma-54-dependent Fis family transcriptional regulator [Geobacter pelophilus]|uniref:Sigma-54-dependent Fis family transcriptional regulator n=1 Tax=Geoanaerobacter pelophilus TaxID=60036 RepID=A0AAW4L2G7_9BACT|nr:sigma-54-dependent Fis family transcriptional regulator [Geoanaerobacter pelophilus]MBT0665133.1 sigma-54-dependent Fis family transcriptional regulator [Geoanaerobacter pelophilus]